MSNHASEGDYAELALAVYVEDLVTQKKVLYVGDPTSAAVERLARAARSVEVVSIRSRVRGTRRGGRVASRRWPGVEDAGRWDVVVVPDLPAAGLSDDDKVAEAARWLAPGGVLVAGTPDPEGPAANASAIGYEDFFDLLEGAFENVRMLGQAPFSGFSVVDFAPESPELEVTFDGSLLEGKGERAVRYYALAGDRDVALDAYAVVQVPSGALERGAEVRPAPAGEGRISELSTRLREQQDALDAANVHAEELERELESMRAELDASRGEVERARARSEQARADRDALDAEIRTLRGQIEALSREERHDEEYARLEAALRECGRELGEARGEVERRGTLVRDLVEELREARGEAPGSAERSPPVAFAPTIPPSERPPASRAQLDEAVGRAVMAEAEKAELTFRLDEVRGELAMAERRCAQELDEQRRLEAALRGTVRGLNARLAEVIELHQLTQARLALAEDDRAAAENRNRRLVRELAEVREQLELEIARAEVRSAAEEEPAAAVGDEELARLRAFEQAASAREGELTGALMRAREEAAELASRQREGRGQAEQTGDALAQLEHRIEGMRAGYEARIAELVRELDAVAGDAERALIQAGELRGRVDAKERTEAALRGELSGVRFRLADREAAADALRARVEDLSAASGDAQVLRARIDELSAERAIAESLRARIDELTAEREASIAALPARVDELTAEREASMAALQARVDELMGERDAVTESLKARADERSSEREASIAALQARVDELTAERDAAIESRARIDELSSEREASIAALQARVDELAAALESARRAPATVEYARDTSAERRAAELAAALGSRDGLLARLQRELADAAERRRALERRLDDCAAKLARTREELESSRSVSDVRAQENERELAELSGRLERSERERIQALDGLEEARSILEQLAGDLPPRRGAGGDGSDLNALRQLRERNARLDAEAADREVLLRSLTAQLQERDDRLRALERMSEAGADGEDPRELQQRLLEMEERVARLTEELEHERAARRRAENPPS